MTLAYFDGGPLDGERHEIQGDPPALYPVPMSHLIAPDWIAQDAPPVPAPFVYERYWYAGAQIARYRPRSAQT
jgi:hypothetical protein